MPQLPDGTRLGPFEILCCLGLGSHAYTYLAFNHRLGSKSRYVLKVPHEELKTPRELEKFVRGARLAAGIHHPNVIQIFDVFQLDDLCFIVMEYIEGEPLDRFMARHPQLSAEAICQLAMQIASGFQAIHDAGVIHRDLKPENILVRKEPHLYVAKIIDFGISMEVDTDMFLEDMVGTPLYVAPEICCGDPPTQLGDVYSFGVLLYEMISGQAPFSGDTIESILLQQVIEAAPPLPVRFSRGVQGPLEAIVHHMMQKRPDKRLQSMSEALERLEEVRIELDRNKTPDLSEVVGTGMHSALEEMKKSWKVLQAENQKLKSLKDNLQEAYNRLESLYSHANSINEQWIHRYSRKMKELKELRENYHLLQQRWKQRAHTPQALDQPKHQELK